MLVELSISSAMQLFTISIGFVMLLPAIGSLQSHQTPLVNGESSLDNCSRFSHSQFSRDGRFLTLSIPLGPRLRQDEFVFDIPRGSRVYVDVGANIGSIFQRQLHEDPNAYVIAIEPNLQMLYGDRFLNHPRIFKIAAAIDSSPTPIGILQVPHFVFSHPDWLATLDTVILPEEVTAKQHMFAVDQARVNQAESFPVRVLTLEQVLKLVPVDVEAIEMVKIDTQGYDLKVVNSVGWEMHRVQKFMVETGPKNKNSSWSKTYRSAPYLDEMKLRMMEFGYVVEHCWPHEHFDAHEFGCVFSLPQHRHPVYENARFCFHKDRFQNHFQGQYASRQGLVTLARLCCQLDDPTDPFSTFCWGDGSAYNRQQCCGKYYLEDIGL